MGKRPWLLLVLLCSLLAESIELHRVVAYASDSIDFGPQLSQSQVCYWQSAQPGVNQLNAASISHVIAEIGVLRPDFTAGVHPSKAAFLQQLASLKSANPQIKIGLEVRDIDRSSCGVNESCTNFLARLLRPSNAKTFSGSLVKLARKNNLDTIGVSFAAQFNVTDYVTIAKAVRGAIKADPGVSKAEPALQFFVSDVIPKNLSSIRIDGLDKYVDWLALDTGGLLAVMATISYSGKVQVNQPFCPMLYCGSAALPSIASLLDTWLNTRTFPASQLQLDFWPRGLPLLLRPDVIDADVRPYEANVTGVDGSLRGCDQRNPDLSFSGVPLYQIAELPVWRQGLDPVTMTSFARYGTNGWLSFENSVSLLHKLCYMRSIDLGGVGLRKAEWDDAGVLQWQMGNALRLSFEDLCGSAYQRPSCEAGASPVVPARGPSNGSSPNIPTPGAPPSRPARKSKKAGTWPVGGVIAVSVSCATLVLALSVMFLMGQYLIRSRQRHISHDPQQTRSPSPVTLGDPSFTHYPSPSSPSSPSVLDFDFLRISAQERTIPHLPPVLDIQYVPPLSSQHLPSPPRSCCWDIDLKDVYWDGWALLGKGAQSSVFKGRYDGQLVAVKLVGDEDEDGSGAWELQHEALILSQITHPHVVQVMGGCLDGSLVFLVEEVMQFTLADYLYKRPGQLMQLQEIVQVGRCLASALCAFHPHCVHRDLKPQNVLMDLKGNVKVSDLGMSRTKTGQFLDAEEDPVGTLPYMAPECFGKGGNIGEQSDVYALGIILWECLAGVAPWRGLEAVSILHKVVTLQQRPPIPQPLTPRWPPPLVSLIQCCWAHNQHERPTAPQVLHNLGQILNKLDSELDSEADLDFTNPITASRHHALNTQPVPHQITSPPRQQPQQLLLQPQLQQVTVHEERYVAEQHAEHSDTRAVVGYPHANFQLYKDDTECQGLGGDDARDEHWQGAGAAHDSVEQAVHDSMQSVGTSIVASIGPRSRRGGVLGVQPLSTENWMRLNDASTNIPRSFSFRITFSSVPSFPIPDPRLMTSDAVLGVDRRGNSSWNVE